MEKVSFQNKEGSSSFKETRMFVINFTLILYPNLDRQTQLVPYYNQIYLQLMYQIIFNISLNRWACRVTTKIKVVALEFVREKKSNKQTDLIVFILLVSINLYKVTWVTRASWSSFESISILCVASLVFLFTCMLVLTITDHFHVHVYTGIIWWLGVQTETPGAWERSQRSSRESAIWICAASNNRSSGVGKNCRLMM